MTRPKIIRADTIDLQDREAPSAQNHAHPDKNTAPGFPAPHQAETLREVAAETAEENSHNPRISWPGGEAGDLQQHAEQLTAGDTKTLANGHWRAGHADGDSMAASQQEDALAIAQNGGLSGRGADDDDLDGDAEDGLDDDMDKISSSPSIEDEDIDFEFVYALHTFVATVEGQANATKGDTMVLLDDSNSYWWLVRVVKDSSIGYLPAEHIETPTERLARLNKHRNIDLSATMLGDQAEKTRNPIKSAIKRRKKTVAFASPTYVDYSDFDYSTEEEDAEADYLDQQEQTQQSAAQRTGAEPDVEDETAKVEPLKPRSQQTEGDKTELHKQEATDDASATTAAGRSSDEIFDTRPGDGPKKSSDGTVRDSFFKDDTVETKKITLTPNLLRDDNAPKTSTDSKDIKQRSSLDKPDKDGGILGKDEKKKKEKKEKDRRPNAIRSFFSRKGRKEADGADDESIGKRSMDSGADVQDRDAEEDEARASSEKPGAPQRQPSKLQKQQPRVEPSPAGKADANQQKESASMRIVEPESESEAEEMGGDAPGAARGRSASEDVSNAPELTPAWSRSSGSRQQKARETKPRMDLDDSDSVQEEAKEEDPDRRRSGPEERQQQQPHASAVPGASPDHGKASHSLPSDRNDGGTQPSVDQAQHPERLPGSPVEMSSANASKPPPLIVDTSSQEEDQSSSRSTPSPELADHGAGGMHGKQDSIATSTSATTTSTWNDAGLRAFFDSGSDIRDLLAVVYDKTDVAPAGPDHPVVGTLFKEQNARLAEITTQLDNMLGDWLARKQRLRGTV